MHYWAIEAKISRMSQANLPLSGCLTEVSKFILTILLAVPVVSLAQTNMSIYTDSLVNGWSDGSYSCTRNFSNTSPVHSGNDSISVAITSAWGSLQFNHSSMTTTGFVSVSFWLNGGSIGGQQLQMYGSLGGVAQTARPVLTSPSGGCMATIHDSFVGPGCGQRKQFHRL